VTDIPLSPLATALDGAARLVDGVGAAQWELPTPCADWTVRQLVNHLVGGQRLFTRVLGGEPLPPAGRLGSRADQDQLGDDPATAFRTSAGRLLAASGAPGVIERTWTVPAGTLPGPAVLHLRTVETLVHGWDLARATGQEPSFPEELAEGELAFSRDLLGRLPEGRSPFGPSRPVGSDAPALDRLAALLGREVGPSATAWPVRAVGQTSRSRSSGPGPVPPESRRGEDSGRSSSGGSSATGPSA
jgi:uncharacterized protein (TIGR03086 family)